MAGEQRPRCEGADTAKAWRSPFVAFPKAIEPGTSHPEPAGRKRGRRRQPRRGSAPPAPALDAPVDSDQSLARRIGGGEGCSRFFYLFSTRLYARAFSIFIYTDGMRSPPSGVRSLPRASRIENPRVGAEIFAEIAPSFRQFRSGRVTATDLCTAPKASDFAVS